MSSAALKPSKSFPVCNGCVSCEKREKKKEKERSCNVTSDSHALCNDRRVSFKSKNAPAHTGMCVRDKCILAALQSAEIQRCYVTPSWLPLWFENTNIMCPCTQMTSPATANG